MGFTQTLSGNASGAVRAVNDLAKAYKRTEADLESMTKAGTKAERQARRLAELADPQKRYNRQLAEAALAAKRGAISLGEAEKVARKYGDRLQRAQQAGRGAFGSGALADIKNYALGFFGVQQAIQAVISALQGAEAERQRVAEAAKGARGGVGSLAQLAATAGDPRSAYRNLVGEARNLRAAGGADTLDEAANTVFALVSAGLDERDRAFAAKLKSSGVMTNVGDAATSYAAISTALGRDEVGTFEQFIAKALAASKVAPAQAQEIPLAAARAAGSAREFGFQDESLYAATAILAKIRGSAAEGGTQLAAFMKQLEKSDVRDQLSGKNLTEVVEFLSTLSAEQQGLGGVLGDRAEAVAGFRALRDNLDLLRSLSGEVDASQRSGLARQAIALPGTDIGQLGARAAASAEGRQESDLVGQAAAENLLDALKIETKQLHRKWYGEGGGAVMSWIGSYALDDLLNGEQRALEQAYIAERARRAGGEAGFSDQFYADLTEYLRQTAENTAEMKNRPPVTGRAE
jgi:hypothetical protein